MVQNQETSNFEQFILSLKNVNIHIAIQSVLDALDIWLSCVKYYFEIAFPSYEGFKPNQTMNNWLISTEGFYTFIAGAVFMALFSFLGNYHESKGPDEPQNLAKIADENWPFFRDAFKGFKWTFKASRNVLEVLGILIGLGLTCYTNVFGISLGVISALNRLWYRSKVEERKTSQQKNESLIFHAQKLKTPFQEVSEEWFEKFQKLDDSAKSLFKGNIFRIKNKENEFECYQVSHHPTLQIIKLKVSETNEPNTISQQEMDFLTQADLTRLDYLHYKKLIKSNSFEHLQHILDEKKHLSLEEMNQANLLDHQKNPMLMFSSSCLGGAFNAPYYFLGLITSSTIPANNYNFYLGVCGIFMILNVVAELYQEFDYQRRLNISANKAKLTLLNQNINFELDRLNELLQDYIQELHPHYSAQDQKTLIIKLMQSISKEAKLEHLIKLSETNSSNDIELNPLIKNKLIKQIETIDQQVEQYLAIRNEFINDIELPTSVLLWQGIRNGLQLYGIVNGIFLILITLAPLYDWTFVETLFYYNFIAAAVLIVGMMTYTYLCAQPQKEQELTNHLQDNDKIFKETSQQFPYLMPDHLCHQLDTNQQIQPSKNLMISEQSEVFRQFTSGFRKGIKFLTTTANLHLFSSPNNPIYYLVGLVYGIYFAFKGLRGLVRVDNNDYEKSLLLKPFFNQTETAKDPIHAPITDNSIISSNQIAFR